MSAFFFCRCLDPSCCGVWKWMSRSRCLRNTSMWCAAVSPRDSASFTTTSWPRPRECYSDACQGPYLTQTLLFGVVLSGSVCCGLHSSERFLSLFLSVVQDEGNSGKRSLHVCDQHPYAAKESVQPPQPLWPPAHSLALYHRAHHLQHRLHRTAGLGDVPFWGIAVCEAVLKVEKCVIMSVFYPVKLSCVSIPTILVNLKDQLMSEITSCCPGRTNTFQDLYFLKLYFSPNVCVYCVLPFWVIWF